MQPYDMVFLALLLISCFAGVVRGGVKELVNLIAFFLALFISVAGKGVMARSFHLDTITSYIAAFVLYVAVYFFIRYVGHGLSDRIHQQQALGLFDRLLGFAIGFVRTLLVLGVFHLIFSAVTPIERQPHWFRDAKIYPLSVKCAKFIQALVPAGTGVADKVAGSSE
jgi:membrane protein required for colicin V production